MSPPTSARANPSQEDGSCLVEAIADLMAREPTLEAVEFEHQHGAVSVATLGKSQAEGLEDRVIETLDQADPEKTHRRCLLATSRSGCGDCDWSLSEDARRRVQVIRKAGSTRVARVTCPTAPMFWRWKRARLPRFVPREFELSDHDDHLEEWKPQLALAALCAGFGLAGALVPQSTLSVTCYAAAYAAGSWFAALEVWERLRNGSIDVHLLMLAVAAGSASIGAWGEGAMLLFLFSFSGALEHYAMGRTQKEIQSLFKAAPKTARVVDADGHEEERPVEGLRRGDRLLIKPGDSFPVDAEIARGSTAADESNLTGEAIPVEKNVGDAVLAGTLNLWGAVEATVTRPASESALTKIIHLIQEANQHKAPVQRFTDRFSGAYTYAVLGLSAAMFFVWWLAFNKPPFHSTEETASAFYRTMTLLVVSSPCALVLSIPSAVLAAIAWGARRGILFRGGAAVERLAEVTVVALDKTGTLTTGELRLETVETFPPGAEREIGEAAYSLERLSHHPLARAITRHGKQNGWKALEFDRFESLSGLGLRASRDGETFLLGNRKLFESEPAYAAATRAAPVTGAGLSEVWTARGNTVGRILLRDDIRAESRRVIESFKREGLRSVVLTGDRRAAAETLREQLAVDDVQADLAPDAKVAAIQALMSQNERVAMVGDGVNDAPSLAAAHVGVAMGSRGSDAALEQAEIVLMHDRLENFLAAYRLSGRARAVIRQNLVVSLGTVAALVACALAGAIPLTIGVLGHEGSTVVVVLNSLRLLWSTASGGSDSPHDQ